MASIIDGLHRLRHSVDYHLLKQRRPPLFIVGCGHSGTSLLLSVLGSHSNIHAIPFESGLAYDFQSNGPKISPNSKSLLRQFDKITIQERKLRWVEKTPRHILCIPQLLQLCPDARIIILIRDGRDVAASIAARVGDLEEGIKRWVSDNRVGQLFWQHPQSMTVRYEDLVTDFEATIKSILEFVGEEFEEAMLSYHEQKRYFYADKIEKPSNSFGSNHELYRNWQINQPLFDGRGRWRSLPENNLRLIAEVAGEMLSEYGYV